MSILIKGMEMPIRCCECPMCHDYQFCRLAEKDFGEIDCIELRADWCPLIEIPPHGRLIDADALEELFREVIGNIFKREEITHVLEHMVRASAMVVEMIKDAPTIIESEGDDG